MPDPHEVLANRLRWQARACQVLGSPFYATLLDASADEVQQSNAADFLERELAAPRRGVATVVFHSVFIQYVDEPTRERIRAAVERSGVFHLAMEPAYPVFEIRLDGELLATSMAHGAEVRWNVDSTST